MNQGRGTTGAKNGLPGSKQDPAMRRCLGVKHRDVYFEFMSAGPLERICPECINSADYNRTSIRPKFRDGRPGKVERGQ